MAATGNRRRRGPPAPRCVWDRRALLPSPVISGGGRGRERPCLQAMPLLPPRHGTNASRPATATDGGHPSRLWHAAGARKHPSYRTATARRRRCELHERAPPRSLARPPLPAKGAAKPGSNRWPDVPNDLATDSASSAVKAGLKSGVAIPYCQRRTSAGGQRGLDERCQGGEGGRQGAGAQKRLALTSRISCWLWYSWSDMARFETVDARATGRERMRERAANIV